MKDKRKIMVNLVEKERLHTHELIEIFVKKFNRDMFDKDKEK